MERTPHVPCGATVTLLGTGAVVGAGLMLLAIVLGLVPGLGPQRQGAPAAPPAVATAAIPVGPPVVENLYVREIPLPLDSDTATPDVLLTVQRSVDGRTTYTLAYLQGDSRTVRWESQPLSERSYERRIAVGPQHIYLADGTRLLALARRDGARAWERTLSDTILNVCRDCLQLVGGSLIALTQDGVLQAFDASGGRPAWSVRLNETPRQLVALGDAVGVLDYATPGGGGATLLLFTPDGRRLRPADSACPGRNPEYFQRPGIYDRLYPDVRGEAVYLVVDGSEGCVIRVGPGGAADWTTPTASTALESWSDGELLMTPEALFAGEDHALVSLDARTGALRQVVQSDDYELTPLAARDGVLVVEAIRTRGSRRAELWGVDIAGGQRRWGHVLLGQDRFVSDMDGGDWAGQLVPGGFALIQAPQGAEQLQIDILRLTDGAPLASATLPRENSASWEGVAWTDRVAWVTFDRTYVVDLASATLRYAWP
ncbi:MAG TPA: PQQ-binding-like beta-propeller repeat protein [Roseiflexaceae bacterium]|nr:PQQ-binding-like beta-propeller repeat protein [Roseiflexaceae bacterium]